MNCRIPTVFHRRAVPVSVLAVLVLALVLPGTVLADAAPDVPEDVRAGLGSAIGGWLKEQTENSENAHGKKTKRGYFSRYYEPAGEGAYHATAHIESAGELEKTTERYLLTLKQEGKKWAVADSELKDTYVGMFRESHGRCYPFDRFDFEREGMELHAGSGSVCINFFQGRVAEFGVHGAGMSYKYEPPEHVQNMHLNRDIHSIHEGIERDHARELEFDPAGFLFSCDPDSCDEMLDAHFTGLNRDPNDATQSTGKFERTDRLKAIAEERDEARRKSPFAHFRRPYRPGNRTWAVYVSRDLQPFSYPGAEDGFIDYGGGSLPGPGVALNYDNWGGFEVTFDVWPKRLDDPEQLIFTIYGYYSEDTLENTDPYALELREDKGSRWHQVYSVKGDVSLGLEDPELLTADIEFGIELKQPQREIPFAIQSIPRQNFDGNNKPRELYVNAVQLDGEELTWTRTGQLGGLIVLPEEMPAGTKLNLRMDFATRALYKLNPSFTYVSRFGWMPFVRFGDFIDEFEMTIRNPVEYKVLGIGHQASEKKEGNVLVTHWVSDSPVVFPSITFGRYEWQDAGKNFDPARKADGTPIPVTVHVDQASFVDWDIRPTSLRRIAQQAINSINLYREISGLDYPYGELNFVNDPQGALYGQAPSSLIYLGSGVFRGEGALAPYFNSPESIANFLKSVTAHEVGHQWWGSRVSNANDRNYWFVESLAEFFSAIYLEAVHGPKEYQDQVQEWRRTILDRRSKSTVQASYSVWGGEDGFGSIQANIYNKGPYAFHMLRQIFGDDKFFDFLKAFSQELDGKREIVTMDIQNAAEKGLGGIDPDGNPYTVDLSWFFDQWIRGVGVPQYSFVYDVRQTEIGDWVIEGAVKQRVIVGSSRNNHVLDGTYYRGVVDITVDAKGQQYKKRLIVDGPETPFVLKVPEKPLEVALNKYNEILAHDVLDNKGWQ